MNTYFRAVAIFVLLTCSFPSSAQRPSAETRMSAPRAAAERLLATDRDFSIASGHNEGLSTFQTMFDENVIMFAVPIPNFARGRSQAVEVLAQSLGGNLGRTEWTPIRVGVSADGQHGFTFGYTVTRLEGSAPNYGKYVSYWILRPEGWRVAFYKRVPRPAGEVSAALMSAALPTRMVPVSSDQSAIDLARVSLDRRERDFSDEAQRRGLRPAFALFGSADAVNVGGGSSFIVGNDAIGESQGTGPSPLVWAPDGVVVATSGDLGVTWGMLRRTGPTPPGRSSTIPWITIWRRSSANAPWLYVAE